MPMLTTEEDRVALIAVIDVGNEASKHVVKKAGFEFVRREDEVRSDGKVFEVEVWRQPAPKS